MIEKVLCLLPVLPVQLAHVRPVEPGYVAKYSEGAWQGAVRLVVRSLILIAVLFKLFTHVLEALRVEGGLLVHVLHLLPLLVVELLHVVSEVLGTHHALGVVPRNNSVPLVHQRVREMGALEGSSTQLGSSLGTSLEIFLRIPALRNVVVGVLELRQILALLDDFLVDRVDAGIYESARMVHILTHEVILAHLGCDGC